MFVSLFLVWLWTGLTVCCFLALFSVLVMFICFFLFSWFVCSYSSAPLTVIWFICLFLSWLLVIMFACLFVFFFGLYAGVLQRPVTVDRSDCLLTRLLTQYRATLPPSSCVSVWKEIRLSKPPLITTSVNLSSDCDATSWIGKVDVYTILTRRAVCRWTTSDHIEVEEICKSPSLPRLRMRCKLIVIDNTYTESNRGTKHSRCSHVCAREVEKSGMISNQRFVRWRWYWQKTVVS